MKKSKIFWKIKNFQSKNKTRISGQISDRNSLKAAETVSSIYSLFAGSL